MNTHYLKLSSLLLLTVGLCACSQQRAQTATVPVAQFVQPSATLAASATSTSLPTATRVPFVLSSAAFEAEGVIPDEYSCKGADLSPELAWGDPPVGTQSLALIFDDPSAGGTWVHWAVYDLPATSRGLPAAIPTGADLSGGGLQGSNSWGELAYGGPCPPQGSTHTYVFTLYALDTALNLEPGASKRDLLAAMEGHVLETIELKASFTR
jgi:Raf kinase inhibitor-like YbhB/YbcL family protein